MIGIFTWHGLWRRNFRSSNIVSFNRENMTVTTKRGSVYKQEKLLTKNKSQIWKFYFEE